MPTAATTNSTRRAVMRGTSSPPAPPDDCRVELFPPPPPTADPCLVFAVAALLELASREQIARVIEALVDRLDDLDGDPDCEDSGDMEPACEDEGVQCDDDGVGTSVRYPACVTLVMWPTGARAAS